MIRRIFLALAALIFTTLNSNAQSLKFEGKNLVPVNVKAAVEQLGTEEVLKVERDYSKLPFDPKNLANTVDEPTFVKLQDLNLKDGIIEVKVMSKLQNPSPFKAAQGFIGLAFRISDDNKAFESIYLRPKVGRSENQFARNHTVQYYAYPDYKFDKLRAAEFKGQYETYADIGLEEWITIRIEFKDRNAVLYLNDQKYPSFIVNEMKGGSLGGSIGLWVDVGTIGFFKDLKITAK